MDLQQILDLPEFQLPAKNTTNTPFITFAENKLNRYVSLLKSEADLFSKSPAKIEPQSKFWTIADGLSRDLLDVLRTSKNSIPLGYSKFETTMQIASMFLLNFPELSYEINKTHFFYRCNSDTNLLPQERFFHAKFDVDELVKATRFSAGGAPALYLTNALIVGFKEINLDKAQTFNFQAVKFNPQSKLNLLNLDYNIPDVSLHKISPVKYDTLLQIKALLYPLLLLCNTEKRRADIPSPQEYIIPQYLAQWVKDTSRYDGIKYPSTKVDPSTNKKDFYNLYIPPQKLADSGYCEALKALFHLSDVCALSVHESQIMSFFTDNYITGHKISQDVEIIEWNGNSVEYQHTIIGIMEFYLIRNMPVAPPIF